MKNLLLFLSLLLTLPAMAFDGFIPIKNYSSAAYVSGPQNWAMAQDRLGRVYIANRNGLLRFDGSRWSVDPLPNNTTVRSVFVDDEAGRVYVGGFGEFGYFSSEGAEINKYHSLVSLIGNDRKEVAEIWNIFRDDKNALWFQSDYALLRLDAGKFSVFRMKARITSSASLGAGRTVIVGLENGDLFRFNGSAFIPVPGSDALRGCRINAILDFDGRLMVATYQNGLFLAGHAGIVPFKTPFDQFIRDNQLFCARASGDKYAFGTVNDGVLLANFRKGTVDYINRRTGLQNNTVLNMNFDRYGSLWLCLDNGISVAYTDSPVSNLFGSDNDAGTGYASMYIPGHLLLGTNQALFSIDWPIMPGPAPVTPKKLLNGQVWGIDTIGTTIFIGSDHGLFQARRDAPTDISQIPGLTGTWCVQSVASEPDYAVASTYGCFYLLKKEEGTWTNAGVISGYDDAGGRFVQSADGYFWFGHWMKGVYRFRLDTQKRQFVDVRLFTTADGLPSNRNNTVVILDGNPVIATEYGVYRIHPDNSVHADTQLSAGMPRGDAVHLFPVPGKGMFVFSTNIARFLSRNPSGSIDVDSLSLRTMNGRMIPGFEHLSAVGGKYIVGSQDGFLIVDPDNLRNIRPKWRPEVFVASVRSNADSLLYMASTAADSIVLKLPYSQNSLRFDLAYPEYRDENSILFSCFLEDYDKEWTSASTNPSKEYTQLYEGSYTLRIRAFNPATGERSESSFRFVVSPPWWRSPLANAIYITIILASLYFTFVIVRRASTKAARNMERRKEEELASLKERAEQEALRKDYEIAALKSEQLEQDVKHKSSELSNITMNVIRKNEVLLNISSKLEKLEKSAESNADPLAMEIAKIRKSISQNISHDDDWKNFNQNFDIVYENYTKRLMERHPDLTKTELRICCYLKMGLSSKDIAPLFNIAPKSVEMTRYRLRKKMNLERADSLTSYLQNI